MDEYQKNFLYFSLLWLSIPIIFTVGYLVVATKGGLGFHLAPIISTLFVYVSFISTWFGFRKKHLQYR